MESILFKAEKIQLDVKKLYMNIFFFVHQTIIINRIFANTTMISINFSQKSFSPNTLKTAECDFQSTQPPHKQLNSLESRHLLDRGPHKSL